MNISTINAGAVAALFIVACGVDDRSTATFEQTNQGASSAGDGVGVVSVTIKASGLDPGGAISGVGDGWTVRYDRLLVAVGDVRESAGSTPESFTDGTAYLVDLRQVPVGGASIASSTLSQMSFEDSEFSTLIPSGKAVLLLASEADRDFMVDAGYSIYIEGSVTSASGRSCRPDDPTDCVPAPTIVFSWGLAAAASYSGCDGFTLGHDETAELTVTLTGDHWFRDNFAAEVERSPRRAQWVADADLDRDGETTLDELKAVEASLLFSPERGYDLSDAASPIASAYDYLAAQVRTIGIHSGNGCALSQPLE